MYINKTMLEKIKKGIPALGLQAKFLAYIIGGIIVTVSLLSGYHVYESQKILSQEMEKRGVAIAQNLAYNSKYGVMINNRDILKQLLVGIVQEEDVHSAAIYNLKGKCLVKSYKGGKALALLKPLEIKKTDFDDGCYIGYAQDKIPPLLYIILPIIRKKLIGTSSRWSSEDELLDLEVETAPVQSKGNLIGYTQITMSLEKLISEKQAILRVDFLIILLVITVGSILSFVFVRRMLKPIKVMTHTTMEIAQGNLSLRVSKYSQDEIGILGDCFNHMVDSLEKRTLELERSNQELRQFAYVASHDLQEPLRKVRNYTEMLARRYEGRLDAKADKFIYYIVDGATRMQGLINDLLTFSRIRKRGISLETTNIAEVMEQVLADLETAIQESKAVVTYDTLPTIRANFSQMAQLLQNLVANALKFRSQEPPHIHLSAKQRGNEWLFSLRDNGIGIEPQYAERIFVIFQRLHSREEYPGTGIGLAICKKIVEEHGGHIWVKSQLGGGATFHFTIPMEET